MLTLMMTIQTLMNTRLKKKTSGHTSLVELLKVLCVSLLALVAFGHSSKADTVTSTVISETSEVISEETTVENQGAGVELHTTTTVTETTTISNQKTVGDEKTTGQYLTNRGFQTGLSLIHI